MSLAFDAASSTTVNTAPSDPITLAHTCSASAERLLVAMIQAIYDDFAPLSVSGVTYNGVALTRLTAADIAVNGGGSADLEHQIWYLVAPASGSNTLSVSITPGTTYALVVGAASFTGADQTTPLGTASTASGDPDLSSGNPTVTVSSASGEIPIAGTAAGQHFLTTLTSNDTSMWNQVDSAALFGLGGGGAAQRAAGAASVTIDWTASATWVAAGVSVKAAAETSGALSSDGAATASLSADSISSSEISISGVAVATLAGASIADAPISSDGASTPQLEGVAGMPAAMDFGGTATVTFDGGSAAESTISADGVGDLSAAGASTGASQISADGIADPVFAGTDANAQIFGEAAMASEGAGDFKADVENAAAVTDNPVLRWGDSPWAREKRRRRELEEQEDEEILLFVRQVMPLLYQRVQQ